MDGLANNFTVSSGAAWAPSRTRPWSFVGQWGRLVSTAIALLPLTGMAAHAQAPSGPLPPKPGVEVQVPPQDTQAKVKVQVRLVDTPVTVRDGHGDMVHNLEAHDFQITDNCVPEANPQFQPS